MTGALVGALVSSLLLGGLLMSGRSLLQPTVTDARFQHPLAYWSQVALAALATIAFAALAIVRA